MLLFFPNHLITIYRHRRKGNTNRYGMSATLTVYQIDIQPSSLERQQLLGGKYGETYDGYVDSTTEVKEGDQIQTEDGMRYSVKGVNSWSGAGLLDGKELSLISKDAAD